MDIFSFSSGAQKGNAWFDAVSRIVGEGVEEKAGRSRLADQSVRSVIMLKARWLLITLLAVYTLFAESLLEKDFDLPIFHLNEWSTSLTIAAVFFVIAYPLLSIPVLLSKATKPVIYLQLIVDLLFVTAAVHWSGGVVSWFWPAYLLVSLESAFLFDKKSEVWFTGAIGAFFYGFLLVLEFSDYLPTVRMPFMEKEEQTHLFELLLWLWVTGLNAAVAYFAAFLMNRIRDDQIKVLESEDALLGFVSSAHDIIFCCNQDGTLVYVNQTGNDFLGIEPEKINDVKIFDLSDDAGAAALRTGFCKEMLGIGSGFYDATLYSKKNAGLREVEVHLSSCAEAGRVPVLWGVCHDITERNIAQRELEKLAHHDILTGLPNRILLHDRLQQAKAFCHRLNSKFAVMFIDLDRFKIINDTLGHAVGDDLLRLVAQRLKSCLRGTDTVARIGGDEFIVLMTNISDRQDVSSLSDKLLRELLLPFQIKNHELFVTLSAGLCVYPDDESDVDMMLQKADIAMYHAKALGRNNYKYYNSGMDQNVSRRFTIANSLRRGLDRHEFRLYYQPKVDVVSSRIVAMEALVRWQHPELGMLSPTEFIQLAEENGLIMELGEWVLREACRQNTLWRFAGMDGLRVAVNLSGYQLQHSKLMDLIREVLKDSGMSGDCLEFEITESVIMQNPEYAIAIINEITAMGIHISIDDFGTGYSSLSHLKKFTVNTLKIDKSFVKDVQNNATDAAIASAIIAMGNSLNLKVIAEGVETEQQMEFLKENNCHQVQGFLISRPLPADEAFAVLVENWQETDCETTKSALPEFDVIGDDEIVIKTEG